MNSERRLTLHELTMPPSAEWSPKSVWLMARVEQGAGYWLQRGASPRELAAGDVVLAANNGQCSLRASRLGPLKLQYFLIDPRSLDGLLTLAEKRQLENNFNGDTPFQAIFGASEPFAREFARIATESGCGLAHRCMLLGLWADAIAGLLTAPPAEPASPDLHERFRRLIGEMPEAELSGCSPRDLAVRLHCSERHFGRLFREEFGVPLHKRQTELRLQRASQLLVSSDEKIITVAYESGFRHLGHFNTMFKRRFGITPSEWRHQQSEKRPARSREHLSRVAAYASVLFATLLLSLSLTAGTQTNSSAPPPAANAAPPAGSTNSIRTFEVQHYFVEGNTVLNPDLIGDVLARGTNAFGKAVTIDDVRAAVGRLQATYRERGFVTVSVTLPQQQITNATIKLRVVEGRLAAINVTGNFYYSSNNVMRALPGLNTNMLLNSHVLQREVDAANENRDRQIYPVIGPGPDPGTSSLQLKVKDRLPMHVHLELNNQATPGTPDLRFNAAVQYNNLWDLEHQVGVQYSFSPEKQKLQDIYSTSPFDVPLIANYSGYYRMPLGGLPPIQEQIDSSPGTFGYSEVTHQFRLPPAAGHPELTFYASRATADTGIQYGPATQVTSSSNSTVSIVSQQTGENLTLNENLGTRISIPLPELASIRSTFSFGLDFKRYRLASFNTNNVSATYVLITNQFGPVYTNILSASGTPPRYASVDYIPFNAGLDLSIPDKLGTTFFNANSAFNVLHALSGNSDFSSAAYTTNARSHYVTVNLGVSREQKIYQDWSVLFRANGQWADGPLISNEQFAMGGTMGVRGYREGEVYGDSGWRVTVEPHTPYYNLHATTKNGTAVPFLLRGSVFVDYGQIAAEPDAGFNHVLRFCGAGFGVTGQIENHLDARFTVAWPMLRINAITPGTTRVYFGLGLQF